MKKNFLIITFVALFAILIAIFFWKFPFPKTQKVDTNIQAQKVSTVQEVTETPAVSASSNAEPVQTPEELRNQEIQNRIAKYGKNETGIPVLMYHFFYDASTCQSSTDGNFTEVAKFEQQLKYLKENDFFFPTFAELADFIAGKIDLPKKSVILTVDDGNITFFLLVAPLIERYQVPVTSFAITSQCEQIPQYQSSEYISFESHSHDLHKSGQNGKGLLVNLSYEKAYADIAQSISIVGSNDAFCYPFGHYNNTAKQVLQDLGYKLAFTTQGGRVKKGMDPFELPRVRVSRDDSISAFIEKVSN